MAKNFEKLIFGGLHEKHALQRGIWVPTQHSLWDQGKPRKTLIELDPFPLKKPPFRFFLPLYYRSRTVWVPPSYYPIFF
jgi:hypothetical protein